MLFQFAYIILISCTINTYCSTIPVTTTFFPMYLSSPLSWKGFAPILRNTKEPSSLSR